MAIVFCGESCREHDIENVRVNLVSRMSCRDLRHGHDVGTRRECHVKNVKPSISRQ